MSIFTSNKSNQPVPQVRNVNYCGTICRLSGFQSLPGLNNLKAARIFGNQVLVSKDAEEGAIGVFFPVECQLTAAFLSVNNLFRKGEWGNKDPEKKGFFEEHGRVRAIKFKGHKSEGFWIPISCLDSFLNGETLPEGTNFDRIGGTEICRKYIVHRYRNLANKDPKYQRLARVEDQIMDGQFRFHYDTENLRRNSHKIKPDMLISISDKWHGTSCIVANLLTNRKLSLFEKFLNWSKLAKVQLYEYGIVWSSRRVVKGVNGESKQNVDHYYKSDLWGVVANEIGHLIPKGITIYCEIVGYTPEGAEIQKGYTYGCAPNTHRTLVYRVTQTNEDGKVTEFSWQQMKRFCQNQGLEMVPELYYGFAHSADISNLNWDDHGFSDSLLEYLEKNHVTDRKCTFNPGKPAEGIVVRIDWPCDPEAFKLKSHEFLMHETQMLDAGVIDIETEEEPV